MRRLLVAAIFTAGLSFAALPLWADEAKLPSAHDIYQAEEAGHYTQAQDMISEVLKAKPDNAKAHFIQSELFARQGQYGQARTELATADRLDPKEEFASARALQELKAQLSGERHAVTQRPVHEEQRSSLQPRSDTQFPWKTLLILAVVVGLAFMLFRRRPPQYPIAGGPGVGGGGPGGYGPPPGYGPGYGGAPGGGMGSGIAGGLASGLAVGAGVVAGEELAHHFLDGRGERTEGGGFIPSAEAGENPNNDMGGNDFGASDPGSWDDGGGGGGGGGGDDWS